MSIKWEEGRQGSGYLKLKLFEVYKMDCWILKYPIGSKIAPHRDEVPNHNHYRLNIRLRGQDGFGLLGKPILKVGRVTLFRPDLRTHWVESVSNRTRYVLSIGWAMKR